MMTSDCMTVVSLVDTTGNGKKLFFLSPHGPFNSEWFYSPHLLWLKIITHGFQTSVGQGPKSTSTTSTSWMKTQSNEHWSWKWKQMKCHMTHKLNKLGKELNL
jgi:hypothetical protein